MLSSQRAAFSRRCRICQNISFFPFIRHKYMNGVTFPKTNMPKDNIYTKLFSIFLLNRKGIMPMIHVSTVWFGISSSVSTFETWKLCQKEPPEKPFLGISLRKTTVYRPKTRSDDCICWYAFTSPSLQQTQVWSLWKTTSKEALFWWRRQSPLCTAD